MGFVEMQLGGFVKRFRDCSKCCFIIPQSKCYAELSCWLCLRDENKQFFKMLLETDCKKISVVWASWKCNLAVL